jgi:hypothetical protein
MTDKEKFKKYIEETVSDDLIFFGKKSPSFRWGMNCKTTIYL